MRFFRRGVIPFDTFIYEPEQLMYKDAAELRYVLSTFSDEAMSLRTRGKRFKSILTCVVNPKYL